MSDNFAGEGADGASIFSDARRAGMVPYLVGGVLHVALTASVALALYPNSAAAITATEVMTRVSKTARVQRAFRQA
jgi:hypothetical protein